MPSEYPRFPIRIGTEDKDLITECTADEFRAWFGENGMPFIKGISDRTLDAEDETFRHRIRYAFILDLRERNKAKKTTKKEMTKRPFDGKKISTRRVNR